MSEASAHSKPPIALLPNLYEETGIDPASIRTVQLGPWTYKVDDGSRNTGIKTRKTVYETMYTLVRLPVSSNAFWSS